MRRTTYEKDEVVEERLYERVTDKGRIALLEGRSENWKLWGHGSCPYYIKEQRNAANQFTGVCKIIEKDKASTTFGTKVKARYSEDDWIYYEKRKQLR